MRNLSRAQTVALQSGTEFIDKIYDVVEEGVISDEALLELCTEYASMARNGKAATSGLCAFMDVQSMKMGGMLAEATDLVHSITNAPYGSIHTAFDDVEYAGEIAALLFYIVRTEIAAKAVIEKAAAKFEEAVA